MEKQSLKMKERKFNSRWEGESLYGRIRIRTNSDHRFCENSWKAVRRANWVSPDALLKGTAKDSKLYLKCNKDMKTSENDNRSAPSINCEGWEMIHRRCSNHGFTWRDIRGRVKVFGKCEDYYSRCLPQRGLWNAELWGAHIVDLPVSWSTGLSFWAEKYGRNWAELTTTLTMPAQHNIFVEGVEDSKSPINCKITYSKRHSTSKSLTVAERFSESGGLPLDTIYLSLWLDTKSK